jgi:hypothetical protein
MFASLFGKSKKEKQSHLALPLPTSKVAETTYLLTQKIDDLEKRNMMLSTKSQLSAQEAIELNKANKKQQALIALNKHKMYEKEIETNNAMLLKLMMQRSTVETMNMNTETFNVMQIANEVLKSHQKAWTSDKIAELTDEMHELMGNQTEISDMISAPIGNNLVTEADFEAEMAALEPPSIIEMSPIPEEAVALPAFPAVPTTVPKAAANMDRELAALEAMM